MPSERFLLSGTEILVGEDRDEAVRIAAGQFAAQARKAAAANQPFRAALSGGSTPQRLFQLLAAAPFKDIVPWAAIHFFWGDERNVPPADPASNYGVARELLLSRVPVPAAQVHRIPTGELAPQAVAAAYAQILTAQLPASAGLPRLDYNLLGLGPDGHTASLFPHRPTLNETAQLVLADHPDDARGWRISLSAPVLNNAAQITFLVTGAEKAQIVARVLQGPRDLASLPAQLIAPRAGSLTWVLDADAAAQLQRP